MDGAELGRRIRSHPAWGDQTAMMTSVGQRGTPGVCRKSASAAYPENPCANPIWRPPWRSSSTVRRPRGPSSRGNSLNEMQHADANEFVGRGQPDQPASPSGCSKTGRRRACRQQWPPEALAALKKSRYELCPDGSGCRNWAAWRRPADSRSAGGHPRSAVPIIASPPIP